MSITVKEAFGSGSLSTGKERSGEKKYVVFGVDSLATGFSEAALAEAIVDTGIVPAQWAGLERRSIKVEQVANDVWAATASYSLADQDPPEGYTGFITTFSTSGSTERAFVAKSQTRMSLISINADDAPDQKLNILVQPDGAVDGVDIVVPKLEFAETHYRATVDEAYVQRLQAMTGTVNQSTFRGLPSETVLFLGASGSRRPQIGDWEVTYSFAARPSKTFTVAQLVGDPVAPGANNSIEKRGHDFLWFSHDNVYDDDAKRTVSRPIAAYVATVYDSTDFATLFQ